MRCITLLWKPFLLTTWISALGCLLSLGDSTLTVPLERKICPSHLHPFSVYSPLLSNLIFSEEQHLLKVQIFCRQTWENWPQSFFGGNLWDLIFHQWKLHASKWQPNQDSVRLNKHAHPFLHSLSICSVSILLDSSDSPEIIVSLGIQDTICKLHSVISRINYPQTAPEQWVRTQSGTSILHDSWNKQYLYVITAIQVVRSRSKPWHCLISSKGYAKGVQSLFSIT